MTTKTWKIGESCKGGIITVEISGKVIKVIGKDWDVNAGYNKNSNQSNAKEFTSGTVLSTDFNAESKIDDFLNDLTTFYYSNSILQWIKSKVNFKSEFSY